MKTDAKLTITRRQGNQRDHESLDHIGKKCIRRYEEVCLMDKENLFVVYRHVNNNKNYPWFGRQEPFRWHKKLEKIIPFESQEEAERAIKTSVVATIDEVIIMTLEEAEDFERMMNL